MISIANAALLGLDSLIATLAVGPILPSAGRRWLLVTLFGLCDGLAVLIGYRFGWGNPAARLSHWTVPIFIVGYGLCCLLAASWKGLRLSPSLIFILPLLMSLDNLAYGAAIEQSAARAVGQAWLCGAVSFALAALGLLPGSLIRFPTYRMRQYCTGAAMLAASVLLLVC